MKRTWIGLGVVVPAAACLLWWNGVNGRYRVVTAAVEEQCRPGQPIAPCAERLSILGFIDPKADHGFEARSGVEHLLDAQEFVDTNLFRIILHIEWKDGVIRKSDAGRLWDGP